MSPRQRECGSVSAAVDQSLPASVRDDGLSSSSVFNHHKLSAVASLLLVRIDFLHPTLFFFFLLWIPEEFVVLQVLIQTERTKNSLTADSNPKSDSHHQTTMLALHCLGSRRLRLMSLYILHLREH